MKTTKTFISFLSVLLLAGSPSLSYADNHSPPPPRALETWACTYNAGQDIDDLMSARDYYVKQAAKAGVELSPAYVWLPFKGAVPMDFLWMSPHDNLSAFAAFSDTFAATPDLSGVQGRFDNVASCRPGLNNIMPVHQREGADASDNDDTTHIASFACDLKHGRSSADLVDLRNHIGGVMGSMGDNSPNSMFMVQPITGGVDVRDVYMFSVYNNVSDWSSFRAAMLPSEAGQSLIRHFNVIVDCDQTLWSGMQVIGDDGRKAETAARSACRWLIPGCRWRRR